MSNDTYTLACKVVIDKCKMKIAERTPKIKPANILAPSLPPVVIKYTGNDLNRLLVSLFKLECHNANYAELLKFWDNFDCIITTMTLAECPINSEQPIAEKMVIKLLLNK
ncbi:unnamed protein product [Meganyctiphanes norvegica]|uniref:Uncharacterized protein n=1 Tax=Meganyctiphanes norvegica TaxID=48144 RepID=A0AAV2QYV8_MEGNR